MRRSNWTRKECTSQHCMTTMAIMACRNCAMIWKTVTSMRYRSLVRSYRSMSIRTHASCMSHPITAVRQTTWKSQKSHLCCPAQMLMTSFLETQDRRCMTTNANTMSWSSTMISSDSRLCRENTKWSMSSLMASWTQERPWNALPWWRALRTSWYLPRQWGIKND